MFMYFPDLLLYHRLKHKHNITKHKTPIFYVVHYQEGSSSRSLSISYSVKGNYKVPIAHHFVVFLFSLRASVHQTARALSSFSQNDRYTCPYDMQEQKAYARIWPYVNTKPNHKTSFPLPSTLYL